jgi:hypothetical protein
MFWHSNRESRPVAPNKLARQKVNPMFSEFGAKPSAVLASTLSNRGPFPYEYLGIRTKAVQLYSTEEACKNQNSKTRYWLIKTTVLK